MYFLCREGLQNEMKLKEEDCKYAESESYQAYFQQMAFLCIICVKERGSPTILCNLQCPTQVHNSKQVFYPPHKRKTRRNATTTFKYGIVQFIIMQSWLMNIPIMFQRIATEILKDLNFVKA